MAVCPELDPAAPLQFVINAAAGSSDAKAKREVIEAALRSAGRRGDLLFCSPAELTGMARQAATMAIATRTAVVAVGGDGTLNAVAQAAHAVGCAIVLVLSGDITQRARPAQFRAARAFADRLGAPELAIPGNHDIPLFDLWTRLRSPYSRYIAAFGADLEPVHRSPDLMVVCVNTTRPWRHKHGEISALQVDRAARLLEGAESAQLRVVVVHQPVAVTRAEDVSNRLRGQAAALRRWAEAGVDLVMGGHIHLPYVTPLHGLARPLWAVQAGTAVSSRVRDGVPNSVNLLRWGADSAPGCCGIEQWDYSTDDRAFLLAKVSEVRPARA